MSAEKISAVPAISSLTHPFVKRFRTKPLPDNREKSPIVRGKYYSIALPAQNLCLKQLNRQGMPVIPKQLWPGIFE